MIKFIDCGPFYTKGELEAHMAQSFIQFYGEIISIETRSEAPWRVRVWYRAK